MRKDLERLYLPETVQKFYSCDFRLQQGVYIAWYDSLWIDVEVTNEGNDGFCYSVPTDNGWLTNKRPIDTRPEAYTEAFKKKRLIHSQTNHLIQNDYL